VCGRARRRAAPRGPTLCRGPRLFALAIHFVSSQLGKHGIPGTLNSRSRLCTSCCVDSAGDQRDSSACSVRHTPSPPRSQPAFQGLRFVRPQPVPAKTSNKPTCRARGQAVLHQMCPCPRPSWYVDTAVEPADSGMRTHTVRRPRHAGIHLTLPFHALLPPIPFGNPARRYQQDKVSAALGVKGAEQAFEPRARRFALSASASPARARATRRWQPGHPATHTVRCRVPARPPACPAPAPAAQEPVL
jgi:hypothetical protein